MTLQIQHHWLLAHFGTKLCTSGPP